MQNTIIYDVLKRNNTKRNIVSIFIHYFNYNECKHVLVKNRIKKLFNQLGGQINWSKIFKYCID